MDTLPRLGEVVQFSMGLYMLTAQVIDFYEGLNSWQVVVRYPANPQYGDDVTTYSMPIADLAPVSSAESA